LGNDPVRFVDFHPVADSQTEAVQDVQIVQISPVDRCAVNDHIFEHAGQADHARAGRGRFEFQEGCFEQLVFPFQRNQPILMVSRGAEGTTVVEIIVLDNQTVDGIFEGFRVETVQDCLCPRPADAFADRKMVYNGESVGSTLAISRHSKPPNHRHAEKKSGFA
jgi:hypothetical protein